jgi:hypothetical protein
LQPPKTKSPVPPVSILQKSNTQTDAEKPSGDRKAAEMMEENEKEMAKTESLPKGKTAQSRRKESTPEPETRASDEEVMPRTPRRAITPREQTSQAAPESQQETSSAEPEIPPSQARNVD